MLRVLHKTPLGEIIDLGNYGDFPYSSGVRILFGYKGKAFDRRFPTEINPSGTLVRDTFIREFSKLLDGQIQFETLQERLPSLAEKFLD
jgi:hypothetical protein